MVWLPTYFNNSNGGIIMPMIYVSFTQQPSETFYEKKGFVEILQNSQENTCSSVWKRDRSFPENFAKFLKTSFLQNTSGRLLLFILI